MATSQNKALSEPAYGATNWDTDLNDNFSSIDSALGSSGAVAAGTSSSYTMTVEETIPAQLSVNYSGTSDHEIIIPLNADSVQIQGTWNIYNNSSYVLYVVCATTPSPTEPILISPFCNKQVLCDGTDVFDSALSGYTIYTQTGGGGSTVDVKLFNGVYQTVSNSGAFTIRADPTSPAGGCQIFLRVSNAAGAGAVTMSGFGKVTGSFTTTVGHVFIVRITYMGNQKIAEILACQ